jgi:predicted HD superfamily hydrolase involved in NAD metabolism
MQTDFARYRAYLEAKLTPHRMQHSEGVAGVMAELAPIYGLDAEQAVTAGLLHDAAKELTGSEQAHWIQAAGLTCAPVGENDYLYLHGPVSAALVRADLGVSDALVLEAITTHTFWGGGAYYHHPLSWCLRFSDLIEPNRGWVNMPWLASRLHRIRTLIYSGRMEEAALLQTGWVLRLFEELNSPTHPNLRRIMIELRQRVTVGDDFWMVE